MPHPLAPLLNKIDGDLSELAGSIGEVQARLRSLATGSTDDEWDHNQTSVQAHIQWRDIRTQLFGDRLFSDPGWDILLHLYLAYLRKETLTAGKLGQTSGVFSSTLLRWVQNLKMEGLVEVGGDRNDRRKTLVVLSRKGARLMEECFKRFPATYILAAGRIAP